MMAGIGHGTRRYPRSRGRMGSRTGPDRATLGIVGAVCAVAGFFALGIILGPAAIACGWLALNRTFSGPRPTPAVVAVVLGAIDTLLALRMLAGATPGAGIF
ncbi:small hydrophobic protein [Streptomyces pharetrae]|uniref:small hydrophobic protein n=1 Tax=Streptomyces pharetrae TaxID=291370 RepID=UPI00335147CF